MRFLTPNYLLHLSSWEEFSHFLLFFSTISSLNLHRKFFVILRFQRILASFKMIVDSKLKRSFESTEASSKKVFTTLNNCLLILNCPPSHFFVTPYIPTSNTHSPHVVRVFFQSISMSNSCGYLYKRYTSIVRKEMGFIIIWWYEDFKKGSYFQ